MLHFLWQGQGGEIGQGRGARQGKVGRARAGQGAGQGPNEEQNIRKNKTS